MTSPAPSHRPSRIYPASAFSDIAVKTGIFYTMEDGRGERGLLYQQDYLAVSFKDNGKEGLILGISDKPIGVKHTIAASGVPVKRHTLILLRTDQPDEEVIWPQNSGKIKQVECLAVTDGPFLKWRPEGSAISAGANYLLIENGCSFFRKSYKAGDMPLAKDLAAKSPEAVHILDHKSNMVFSFDPISLENLNPISHMTLRC